MMRMGSRFSNMIFANRGVWWGAAEVAHVAAGRCLVEVWTIGVAEHYLASRSADDGARLWWRMRENSLSDASRIGE